MNELDLERERIGWAGLRGLWHAECLHVAEIILLCPSLPATEFRELAIASSYIFFSQTCLFNILFHTIVPLIFFNFFN